MATARYSYEAFREVRDTIEFDRSTILTSQDPARELRSRGWRLIRATRIPVAGNFTWWWNRVPPSALSTYWLQMAGLAHLSIGESLRICASRCRNKRLARAIRSVAAAERGGTTFADAIARQPEFPPIQAAFLAAAAERRGDEARRAAYERLATMTDRGAELYRAFRSAALRLLVTFFVALACAKILVWAQSQMQLLSRTFLRDASMPAVTTATVAVIDAITSTPAVALLTATIIASIVGMVMVHRSPKAARLYEGALYRLPHFGGIARAIDTAQFAWALSSTIIVSSPADAVAGAKIVCRRQITLEALDVVERALRGREGKGYTALPDAIRLAGPRLDPLLQDRLIGARSGDAQTSALLSDLSQILEREAFARLRAWTDHTEPIILTGIVILFTIALTFLSAPLFSMMQHALQFHSSTYYIPGHK